jgi:hypothetical protein
MGVVRPEAKLPGDPANALITYAEYSETLAWLGGGNTPPTLTIVNGVITLPTNLYGSGYGIYRLDTQGGASTDDLDTINGSQISDIIELSLVNASHTIRLRHAVGNLRLQGGLEFTLNSLSDGIIFRNRNGTILVSRGQFNVPDS